MKIVPNASETSTPPIGNQVDLILCMPDLTYSKFVIDTLIPTVNDKHISRIMARVGMRSEYAREVLLNEFLKGPSDWAFIVDTDMVLPIGALSTLLSRGKHMITGMYFGRGDFAWPVFFTVEPIKKWPKTRYFEYDINATEPFEVGGCGHGCLLIHRTVLEAIEPPYSQLGPMDDIPVVGSDVRLGLKVREAGFKIWCDPTVKCGHIRPESIEEKHWIISKEKNRNEWERYIKRDQNPGQPAESRASGHLDQITATGQGS